MRMLSKRDLLLGKNFERTLKNRQVICIGIPVEILCLRVPSREQVPELFLNLIRNLLRAKISSIEKLQELTNLNPDLLDYIFKNELFEEVKIIGDHIKLLDNESISKNFNDHPVFEMREVRILRIISTGELIPRPFIDCNELLREPDNFKENGFPELWLGSKGTRYPLSPLLLFDNSKPTKITEESIRDSWDKYFEDYDASLDYHGEEQTRKSAGPRIPNIREIHSFDVEQQAYLLTIIIRDKSFVGGWSCADPFGLYQEIGLKELKNAIEKALIDGTPAGRIVYSKIREFTGLNPPLSKEEEEILACESAKDEISKRFGEKLPETLKSYLKAMNLKVKEYNECIEDRKIEKLENLLGGMQLVLESLFKNVWKDPALKDTKPFKNTSLNVRGRKELLLIILKSYDVSDCNKVAEKFCGNKVWKDAGEDGRSLKSALLEALFSAHRYAEHPFRKVLSKIPTIPLDIWRIADYRNKDGNAHAKEYYDVVNIDDKTLQEMIEKTYEIVETFSIILNWKEIIDVKKTETETETTITITKLDSK